MTTSDLTSRFSLLMPPASPGLFTYVHTHTRLTERDSQGEKVTAKAHGGSIDIQGITIARVDAAVRLQAVETWFDPMDMFRQIAPAGHVTKTKQTPTPGEDLTTQLHGDETAAHEEQQPDQGMLGQPDQARLVQTDTLDVQVAAGCPFLAS